MESVGHEAEEGESNDFLLDFLSLTFFHSGEAGSVMGWQSLLLIMVT